MKQTVKASTKRFLKSLPPVRRVLELRDQRRENETLKEYFGTQLPFVPNGHFYSPIPCLEEVQQNEARIFIEPPARLPGIDLREDQQLELLRRFAQLYQELPFTDHRQEGYRYFYENPSYSYSDAIFLYCMIRHARPKKFVEVGSGYSSCVTLDTNEFLFDNSIDCTFIEPYPDLLHSLLKERDLQRVHILPSKIQDVDLHVFEALAANDILFIDSTHVSKTGSDVNRILFEILPALASGVFIHFHDIFYPFEYPKAWVYEGRAWNEVYALRAFLQYNSAFEIVCFNTFMERFHEDFFIEHMPLCLKNPGGSIWLRKR